MSKAKIFTKNNSSTFKWEGKVDTDQIRIEFGKKSIIEVRIKDSFIEVRSVTGTLAVFPHASNSVKITEIKT